MPGTDEEILALLTQVQAELRVAQSTLDVMENSIKRQDAIQRWYFAILAEMNPQFAERLQELKGHTSWFDDEQ